MKDPDSDLHPSSRHSPPEPTLTVAPPASPGGTTDTKPVDASIDLLEAWQISPSTHAQILHTSILPAELYPFLPSKTPSPSSSSSSNTKPLAVLVLGQTGAGKTRLAPLLLRAMQQQQQQQQQQCPSSSSPNGPLLKPLHLIADTFKTYHPFYSTCLATAPHLASQLASRDAAEWLLEVCCAAAGRRARRVLVETACRKRPGPGPGHGAGGETQNSYFERLVRVFSDKGYSVRVVILAVPAALSRLGILVRYYKRLPEAGSRWGLPVRLTPRAVHDLSYEGLAEAVGWLDHHHHHHGGGEKDGEGKGGVERVVVVRRNGRVVYDANGESGVDDGGRWKKEKKGEAGGALRALEAERTRGLSVGERKAAEEDIAMLKGLGEPGVMKQAEEIQGLIDELGIWEDGASPDMVQFDVEDFVSNGVS
ncbi:hypothetical protein C8A03DRAFT_40221 [Achaetomium macrosporum]|uniref:Zeta toxin domain-containing protein n=1 Tax=Achaetomium macrosporum TaxID=79813 RepID=A0AAN7HHM1_9PEZI|nr:hypothetical protein C8A03DRAFT_40221 [Achaetomium macrosporum]